MTTPFSYHLPPVLLAATLFVAGCATSPDEPGAEIRKGLGVTRDAPEKTENSLERNYDPKVILKRAEAFYEREEYIEAAAEYQHFIDLHPLHEWADYALFRLGMSHFRRIGTIDRDPEPVQKAMETFQRLLSVYPQTQYADEVRSRIRACQEILARNQLYVGRFYFKKAAYPAAIARFKQILSTYPDLPAAPEALYYLGLAYYKQGSPGEAIASLRDLLARYPDTPYREDAEELLTRLDGTVIP
jgi:outer membrane protein assembly factor BamD